MRPFILLASFVVMHLSFYAQLPVETISEKEIQFSFGGQNMRMVYFSNQNLNTVNPNNTIAIINIHGLLKFANLSLKRMLRASEITGFYNNTIVVAPQFFDDVDVAAYSLSPDYLYWSSINASSRGSNSANTNASVSSFTVLDEIINTLIANNPNLCQIILAGHSSGGQMVARYAVVNQSDGNVSVPIRYIVSNPSSYVYMNNERRVAGTTTQFSVPNTACVNYNNWKYGLDNLVDNPYSENIGVDVIRNQFKDREVRYLMGELDNNPLHPTLDISCSAMLQGSHRLERGNIYFNYLQYYYSQYYGFDITTTHSEVIVPNVAHASSDMILSVEGLSAIFNIDASGIYDQMGWAPVTPVPVSSYLLDVFFTDMNHGWSCGTSGKIIKTSNGGQSWQQAQVNGTALSAIRGIHMINSQTGWACRSFGKVLKTVDGGNTWTTLSNGVSNKTLRSIYFTDSNHGWAVGSSGVIIRTTNGGASWSLQSSGTNEILYKVFFINNQNGWAVGANGVALRTTNGGNSWITMNTNVTTNLRSVFFINNTQGWLVGLDGLIQHTINGGTTWTTQVSTTDSWLRDVFFVGNEGWVTGSNGKIIHTYDGGNNWIQQTSGSLDKLAGIFTFDNQTVWIVGDNGTILKTENAGHPCVAAVNLGNDFQLAVNETVELSANPNCYTNSQYLWSTGETTSSILVNGANLSPGQNTFTVTVTTGVNCSASDAVTITVPDFSGVQLSAKVFLQGPYNSNILMMSDYLRQNNVIPLTEPYTALGFNQVIGGGETTTPAVLSVMGNNAIVDWVFVELRSPVNPSIVLATQSALLQRDGDVVGVDGISSLLFDINISQVTIAISHRNHHGVRTLNSFTTSSPITIDFSSSSTPIYGFNPMNSIGGVNVLVSGDANKDGVVNPVDKNGFWQPQNGQSYNYNNSSADFNMDGVVNPVDKNGFWHPNNSRIEQL